MMKNKLLIALLLTVGTSYAQVPFFPQGAEWRYIEPFQGQLTFVENCKNYTQYKVEKDTLIEILNFSTINGLKIDSSPLIKSFTCTKVTGKRFKKNKFINNLQSEFFYQKGKKVYFYNRLNSKFNLLYDFGALKGDTIKVFNDEEFYEPFSNNLSRAKFFKYVIDSIATITLNGKDLTRQFIHPICPDNYVQDLSCWGIVVHRSLNSFKSTSFLTEKIGSSSEVNSFMGTYYGLIYITAGTAGLIYYQEPGWQGHDRCNLSELESKVESFLSIQVYENQIVLSNLPKTTEVQILDILGRVYPIILIDNQAEQNITISTASLPSGMYLIKVLSNSKFYVQKFIK